MSLPIIIGITGLPSAGKGLFCEVAKNYGFNEIIMGDVIRNELIRRGLAVTRENSNKIMLDIRKENGENAVAVITLKWIEKYIEQKKERILVDGIRSLAEVETFKDKFPNFRVIAIHADPSTRLKRALERGRIDDAFSTEEFFKRDAIELEVGIGDVISKADILISTPGDIEDTREKFVEIIKYLIHKEHMSIEVT